VGYRICVPLAAVTDSGREVDMHRLCLMFASQDVKFRHRRMSMCSWYLVYRAADIHSSLESFLQRPMLFAVRDDALQSHFTSAPRSIARAAKQSRFAPATVAACEHFISAGHITLQHPLVLERLGVGLR